MTVTFIICKYLKGASHVTKHMLVLWSSSFQTLLSILQLQGNCITQYSPLFPHGCEEEDYKMKFLT